MNYLKYETRDHIAKVTLNSPDTRNSLSEKMGEEFMNLMQSCRNDTSLRVLVLTGSGSSFSSGGDFKLLEENMTKTCDENMAIMNRFYAYFLSILELEIPTIASINGPAIGAGFCLALTCDLRIAARDAKLGMTFIKLGLHPGMAGTFFLPRIAGVSKALELFYTGKRIDAEEAYRSGLLNSITDHDNLENETMKLATTIASNAPIPLKQIKRAVLRGVTWDLGRCTDYEARAQAVCYNTEDYKTGLNSVRTRQTPEFTGK